MPFNAAMHACVIAHKFHLSSHHACMIMGKQADQ